MDWRGYQGSLYGNFLDDGPLPFGIGLRLDRVNRGAMDFPEAETLSRITFAGFIRPSEVTVLKVEYLHYFQGNADLNGDGVFAQLVIGFK
jgi:hypothetical protein